VIEAGRYAAFVWPAYLITAAAFAWMIIDTLVRARAWRRRVESLEAARRAAAAADGGASPDRASGERAFGDHASGGEAR